MLFLFEFKEEYLMAKTKAKQLTVAAMKKKDTQYNHRKEVRIDGYVVNVDIKFRPTKIQSVLDDYREMTNYIIENKISIDVVGMLYLLMVKHFTDLEISDDPVEQLLTLNIMIDNEFLKPIVESFDQEEVTKFHQMMNIAKENYKLALEELRKEFEQGEAEAIKELEDDKNATVQ